MPHQRRYPVLVAFLQQALLHHTDVAVELFDQCLWSCHGEAHIKGRINRQRVLDWWDEMLRAAGSMKLGYVTASLLVQKMQAYPQ